MPDTRTMYVQIFVHADVLDAAQASVYALAEEYEWAYDNPHLSALRDLVDPLPEIDIYGHLPYVSTLLLPTIPR